MFYDGCLKYVHPRKAWHLQKSLFKNIFIRLFHCEAHPPALTVVILFPLNRRIKTQWRIRIKTHSASFEKIQTKNGHLLYSCPCLVPAAPSWPAVRSHLSNFHVNE